MDPLNRPLFNRAWSDSLFGRYMARLEAQLGQFPFRVAETPLLMTPALRDSLAGNAKEIVRQLQEPALLDRLKQAIPPRYFAQGMDALPNCVQVDFALTASSSGGLEGKVVELQAFPSLYALMKYMAEAWGETLSSEQGLRQNWRCFIGMDGPSAVDLLSRTILGGQDPNEVVLVDFQPDKQKTSPDFVATRRLFGVDSVCVTELKKQGRQLYRIRDGRSYPVKRIFNRMVFDELEVKGVQVPFAWGDDLDVTWCSHPNWYWTWSKFALPFLDHPAVPRSVFLSELKDAPAGSPFEPAQGERDLSRYVLKPLFSFAGAGVIVDVTHEDLARIPAEQRSGWVLQEKIDYAPAITMPDGSPVKAEVRVMMVRPPDGAELTPLLCLVRLSRGKMLGVDFNRGLTWVGGSVGIWAELSE